MVFVEKTVALAIDRHGFADNLMDIRIGPVPVPRSERGHNVNAFDHV